MVFFVTIINVFFSFHNQAFNENTFTYQEQTAADFSVLSDLLEDEDETFTDDEVSAGGTQVSSLLTVLSLDPHLHHWTFSPFHKDGLKPATEGLFLTFRKLLI
ncbi:MAG: hypothetical protein JSS79_12720 [Bacteroidetes bacterium]|nr:hypothetical protein [Bacteroidota bacterium]